MRIIAIANQKGGVGKTAATFNLAHALNQLNQKVLMVDLDPQGSLTDYAGYEPADLDVTIYQVLHEVVPVNEAILKKDTGPDLLPANIDLAAIELELAGALSREFRLDDALKKLKDEFDFVVIDCPPSLGLLTLNGLIAATEVIVPVATQYSALRGLERLYNTIGQIQKRPNPNLKVLGILPTMFDSRTLHSREALEVIKESASSIKVFDPIPFTVRIQESPVAKQPLFQYAPDTEAARRFQKLAKEVINGS